MAVVGTLLSVEAEALGTIATNAGSLALGGTALVNVEDVSLFGSGMQVDVAAGTGTITAVAGMTLHIQPNAYPFSWNIDDGVYPLTKGRRFTDIVAKVALPGGVALDGDPVQITLDYWQRGRMPLGIYGDLSVVLSEDLTEIYDIPGQPDEIVPT